MFLIASFNAIQSQLRNPLRLFPVSEARKSDFTIDSSAIVVSNLNQLMSASPAVVSDWTELNDLDLADPEFLKPAPIDMLLGSDILPLIIKSGVQKNIHENLLGQETEFGWIISGNPTVRTITSFGTWIASSDPLSYQLKQFWELENVPDERKLSEADAWCEQF